MNRWRSGAFASALCAVVLSPSCDNVKEEDWAYLRGRLEEEYGSQRQGLGEGFGGSGSASAAARVKVYRVSAGGSLSVVGEAQVQSSGYNVRVPPSEARLVIQSEDAEGRVRASAVVHASGSVNATSAVAPMNGETSVEAGILVELAKQGMSLDEINTVDLRARVNANMAQSLGVAVQLGVDANVAIRALARGIAAAQRARVKAYAQAGVTITAQRWFDAQLSASAKLDAALDSGADPVAAYAEFYTSLDAADLSLGVSAKIGAQAETSSSISFRASVSAQLDASSGFAELADASARAAAALEARAVSVALVALLDAAGLAGDAKAAADASVRQLSAGVSASASASASVDAFRAFKVSITGGADVSTGVLGKFLAVNAVNKTALQTAIAGSATAASQLDTSLAAAAGLASADALADAVVAAQRVFITTVEAQAATLAAFGGKATPAVEVLALVEGGFRQSGQTPSRTDGGAGSDGGSDGGTCTVGCGDGGVTPECTTSAQCPLIRPCCQNQVCGIGTVGCL